ncbi:MAG: hypothetical protein JNM68_05480, partial [Dinghuibacter sp.]|nr:hypothetical protein [Dinghuibacter sp.]
AGSLFVRSNGAVNGSAKTEPIDVPEYVKKYEMAGGSIINAVHYASIRAIERRNGVAAHNGEQFTSTASNEAGHLAIYLEDVLQGIKREMNKEVKPFLG